MRIGVDITCWANGRGYGRFTRELVPTMARLAPADTFVWIADPLAASRVGATPTNVELIVVPLGRAPTEAAAADDYRSPVDMLRLTRAVRRLRLDAFFSPSVYSYFPLPWGLPAVVTIHDAIAERFPELTLPTARARLFWRAKVWLALRQADAVLTVSPYAAREITAVLGVPSARVRVAEEAPAAAYFPAPPDEVAAARTRADLPVDATWFTYVGGFNPHKNVDVLLRAHAALADDGGAAPHLLLVGTVSDDVFHGNVAELQSLPAQLGTEHLVHWLGFVPDETLRALHTAALGLVLASTSEGFGLPAVEAAACGAPVVATTESPLPELLAGGGLFVAPRDPTALTDALRRLATSPDLRRTLGERGRSRATALRWEHGAEAALAAVRDVVS